MPIVVRSARQASPCTGRWWPDAASGLVLAALVVLSACPAAAQSAPSQASFDARFAAVESPGEARAASANANSGGQKESGATSGKSDPPALRAPDARASYRALIEREAARAGLPPEIAEAVMAVESGYNAGAIGGVGEIGLMQILPSTARMLGFVGSNADLAVPDTNIHYGVTYLARAWRLAGGDLCTAAMKYRAGHGETRFSFLSVNYCLAVRAKLAARGYRVIGSVPVATFGERGGGCGRRCLGGQGTGRVNLAALNTRLSAIVMQVRATR
jgi:soluble lytic murein transglycosylase-like protein